MREPLLLPLAAFMAGILASPLLGEGLAGPALAGAFFLLLACLLHLRRFPRLRSGCLLLALAAGGAGTARQPRPPEPELGFGNGRPVKIEGCIISPLSGPSDRPWFLLDVANRPRIRVSVAPRPGGGMNALEYGARIALEGAPRRPRNYRNPGGFDYAGWLAARDVLWQMNLPARTPLRTLPGTCGTKWRAWIYRLRGEALTRLDMLYADRPYDRGMMKGLLIGETSEIRRVWVEDFRRTGTYHALVISGSHVSFLAGLFLLWLAWSRSGEFPVLVLACLVAWVYALVAGGDAPVTRSAAGFTVAVAARFFYRRIRLLNVIAAVALLFLAFEPWQLREASFQLSFLAVAAIAAIALPVAEITSGLLRTALRGFGGEQRPKPVADAPASALRVELLLLAETIELYAFLSERTIRRIIAFTGRTLAFFWDLALVSASVQLALVLPMVFYFHRLSLSGLTANVVATPLITLAIPFGFAATLAGWHWSAWCAAALLEASRRVVAWHAAWEPQWRVPDPPLTIALLFAAAVLLLCLALRFRRAAAALAALAIAGTALALIVVHPFPPRAGAGLLELSAIDVGQGESLLLVLPDRRAVMIDAGGLPLANRRPSQRFDIGEDVVSPYLWSRGFRRIEALVISHLHADHAGGAPALIENFRPRELWLSEVPRKEHLADLLGAAARRGARVRFLQAGDRIELGAVRFEALAPRPGLPVPGDGGNGDSLVLRVSFGARRILLTGDLERKYAMDLLAQGLLDQVDVLKVPHHGSRRSIPRELLETARPSVALISAGFENQFRLPSAEVVDALHSLGSVVLRTDTDGLVGVRTDGRRLDWLSAGSAGLRPGLWDPF